MCDAIIEDARRALAFDEDGADSGWACALRNRDDHIARLLCDIWDSDKTTGRILSPGELNPDAVRSLAHFLQYHGSPPS